MPTPLARHYRLAGTLLLLKRAEIALNMFSSSYTVLLNSYYL